MPSAGEDKSLRFPSHRKPFTPLRDDHCKAKFVGRRATNTVKEDSHDDAAHRQEEEVPPSKKARTAAAASEKGGGSPVAAHHPPADDHMSGTPPSSHSQPSSSSPLEYDTSVAERSGDRQPPTESGDRCHYPRCCASTGSQAPTTHHHHTVSNGMNDSRRRHPSSQRVGARHRPCDDATLGYRPSSPTLILLNGHSLGMRSYAPSSPVMSHTPHPLSS